MPTLNLHIGHNKTGSSYSQSALALGVHRLEHHGLRYPLREKLRERAANGHTTMGNIVEFRQLLDGQCSVDAMSLLFSSEMIFEHLRETEFRHKVSTLAQGGRFESINVLMFVRDPVAWAASSYQQQTKGRGQSLDISDYFAKWDGITRVEEALHFWDSLPNVRVSLFNYSTRRASILPIMEDWLGVPHGAIPVPTSSIVNRSLTFSELELQRAINQIAAEPSGHLLSHHLCNDLPEIVPDDIRPPVDCQNALWERILPGIERLNSRLPEADRYSRERDVRVGRTDISEKNLTFQTEQAHIIARIIVDLDRKARQNAEIAETRKATAHRLYQQKHALEARIRDLEERMVNRKS